MGEFPIASLIPRKIRSYVSSSVFGKSANAFARRAGMQWQTWATWQSTHLYLQYITEMSKSHEEFSIDVLHPVGFFREDVDGQFSVLFFPHFCCTRVNDRLDVVLDIPLLSTFIMQ
jgi:hypothetical protein